MAFLLAEVRQAEGFYDAAPTEAKNVAFEAILLMPARVVYNGRRAEDPCGKTMLNMDLRSGSQAH